MYAQAFRNTTMSYIMSSLNIVYGTGYEKCKKQRELYMFFGENKADNELYRMKIFSAEPYITCNI